MPTKLNGARVRWDTKSRCRPSFPATGGASAGWRTETATCSRSANPFPSLGLATVPACTPSTGPRRQPTPWLAFESACAKSPKELADVANKQVGLLHSGEVAAAIELRPVNDVVRSLGKAPNRRRDLVREHRYPGRHRGQLDLAPRTPCAGEFQIK